MKKDPGTPGKIAIRKWLGWLLERFLQRRGAADSPSLKLVERVALGPQQSIALIEVQGHRLLVASSAEGAPAFYALKAGMSSDRSGRYPHAARISKRVSW